MSPIISPHRLSFNTHCNFTIFNPKPVCRLVFSIFPLHYTYHFMFIQVLQDSELFFLLNYHQEEFACCVYTNIIIEKEFVVHVQVHLASMLICPSSLTNFVGV